VQFELNPHQVLRRNSKILSTEVGEEIALMSIDRGRYYGLNRVATEIWTRLVEPTPAAELASALIQDYRGDAAQIESDVFDLIRQLAEEGLIDAQLPVCA
jgi:hypothetical protein